MPSIIASCFVGLMIALAAFMTAQHGVIILLAVAGMFAFVTHQDLPLRIRQVCYFLGIAISLLALALLIINS